MVSNFDQGKCNRLEKETLDELELHVSDCLEGQVRQFKVQSKADGLVLQGASRTYYAKQMAQEAVMAATDARILANDIEVR